MAAPRRNGWAMPLFMALLVAVPIIEVWILLRVGHAIGGLPTVAILVAEAAVGAWLMKREGSRAWQALRATLGTGRMPATELTDAALVLVGGVLLMLPGFLTDVFGFFFLLPFTRPLARRLVEVFAARQVQRAGVDMDLMRARTSDMTIDGEVVQGETGMEPPSDGQDPPAITGRVL